LNRPVFLPGEKGPGQAFLDVLGSFLTIYHPKLENTQLDGYLLMPKIPESIITGFVLFSWRERSLSHPVIIIK
jgi:hypothetical protein